jgi:hypothetical protein
MDLAKRDITIKKMVRELDNRRNMLLSHYRELLDVQDENEFLLEVTNDYAKYYQTIKTEREMQKEALNMLSDYIGEMTMNNEVTESMLRESKRQQTDIMDELMKIKNELNEMI